jgi:hypothetical protein
MVIKSDNVRLGLWKLRFQVRDPARRLALTFALFRRFYMLPPLPPHRRLPLLGP